MHAFTTARSAFLLGPTWAHHLDNKQLPCLQGLELLQKGQGHTFWASMTLRVRALMPSRSSAFVAAEMTAGSTACTQLAVKLLLLHAQLLLTNDSWDSSWTSLAQTAATGRHVHPTVCGWVGGQDVRL